MQFGVLGAQIGDVRITDAVEVDGRPLEAVVPPHRDGVPLGQLEEALQDRFRAAGAGGVAVGVRPVVRLARLVAAGVVAVSRWGGT